MSCGDPRRGEQQRQVDLDQEGTGIVGHQPVGLPIIGRQVGRDRVRIEAHAPRDAGRIIRHIRRHPIGRRGCRRRRDRRLQLKHAEARAAELPRDDGEV